MPQGPQLRLLLAGLLLAAALFVYLAGPGFFGLEVDPTEAPASESPTPSRN